MPIVTAAITALGAILDVHVHISVPLLGQLNALGRTIPPPILVRGLIDTGASGTCLDPSVVAKLGLLPTGSIPVHTASTAGKPQVRYQYDVSLWLPIQRSAKPHNIRMTLPVIETDLSNQGIELLLGRNILDGCLFVYDGAAGSTTLAFP